MPRSPDLAIFVLTTDNDRQRQTTTDKIDYITPCACARGNYTSRQWSGARDYSCNACSGHKTIESTGVANKIPYLQHY